MMLWVIELDEQAFDDEDRYVKLANARVLSDDSKVPCLYISKEAALADCSDDIMLPLEVVLTVLAEETHSE